MLNEITDEKILSPVRMVLQNLHLIYSPHSTPIRLYKLWNDEHANEDVSIKLYRFDAVNEYQMLFSGLVSMPDGHVYLDARSMLTLVVDMIDSALARYNAGHDPRYRGM